MTATTDSLDVLACFFLYLPVGVEGLGGALSVMTGDALILGRVLDPDCKKSERQPEHYIQEEMCPSNTQSLLHNSECILKFY